jgi:tRNA(Ile2) C34 agmatinyltransferase TiaS
MENIKRFEEKREKSQAAAAKRWENANAKQTHSKRNANAKRTQCQQNKTKQKDGIAIKGNTNPSASSVAAAAVAAPLAAKRKLKPPCPLCGTPMKRNGQTAKWDCPNCMDSFTDSKLEEMSA